MGAPMGRETDALAFFATLAEAPYRYDFYQTLRRLECLYADKPRWGKALRPSTSPCGWDRTPTCRLRPRRLRRSRSTATSHRGSRCGCSACSAPTDHCRSISRSTRASGCGCAGDPTLSRFLDVFHHRFLALFYRAWAQAQPHVNRDRPKEDRFTTYVGAFVGMSPVGLSRLRRAARPCEVLPRGLAHSPGAERRRAVGHSPALFPRARRDRGVRRSLDAAGSERADAPVA